jgi:hypothetical protein
MRSACAGRDLVSRRILEPSGADAAAAAARTDMMVYPDPQWSCSATAPMLQLYDDVGYRGEYLGDFDARSRDEPASFMEKKPECGINFV